MIGFLFALLFISVIAAAVLVAFALPNIRGGARVLTPEGHRLAQRIGGRLRPVVQVVWPRVRPVVRRVAGLARRFVGPVVVPLARRLRPMTDAFLQASFEGVGPTVRPDPATSRQPAGDRQPAPPASSTPLTQQPLLRPTPRPTARPTPRPTPRQAPAADEPHLVVDLRDGVVPHATAVPDDSAVGSGHR